MLYTFKDFHEFLNQPVSYEFFSYANESYKETKCYYELHIGKKSGGTRILRVPNKKLKWLQRRLLPILVFGPVSPCACAYRADYSVINNAAPHVGQKLLVKLDIENFFGSIRFSQVFHAIDLSLASCPDIGSNGNYRIYNSELSWYFSKICTLNGSLPQGAPTSPILSNLVFSPLDTIITGYCKTRNIIYTRYSDDMTFSGDFSPSGLISFVRKLLAENGFNLNEDKTVIAGRGKKHLVTGAVVNEKVQAQRSYKRKIRQELYFIGKYGINEHLEHCNNSGDPIKKLQCLLGQINYVLQLDPQNTEFTVYKNDCIHLLGLIPHL